MPGNPLTDPNWADDTTDTVIRLVGQVRDKTTKPLVMAARGLVFGIIAVFLGMFAVILLLIIATRAIQSGFDAVLDHDRSVYVSYLLVGGIFCLAGLLLFKKRSSSTAV